MSRIEVIPIALTLILPSTSASIVTPSNSRLARTAAR
jgi:hypothetical protein